MGANPVQIEIGEFDEAIEVVEDVIAESKFTLTHLFKATLTHINSLKSLILTNVVASPNIVTQLKTVLSSARLTEVHTYSMYFLQDNYSLNTTIKHVHMQLCNKQIIE